MDRELLGRMTTAMGHRGPDGSGLFAAGGAGLGHRRLSIIDVEGGAQPIGNEDNRLQIVFNGEIYNYVELRDELEALGHQFRTRSDTEVIVHAFEQWGEESLSRLNGMFAFAILDTVEQTMFLARDHLGIKPLYYMSVGARVVFASEIKSLMQHPHCPREVDVDALAELFTFRCVPSPKTLFKDIFKLPPGHLMRITSSGVEIKRFWNWVPKPRKQWLEDELIEEYQDLLFDAVRLQLRSDVPLGLFLSSGVDSGALLALMSQQLPGPVQAFTIGFEGGDATNEVDDAREMARRFGADHHFLTLSPRDYVGYYQRYMDDIEEPVGHEAAAAFYFLAKGTAEHVKVALTGQGADEPWAGYHRYIGIKLSDAYSRLPHPLTQSIAAVVGKIPGRLERLKRGVASLNEPDMLTRFTKVYSFFGADMKAQLYKGAMRQQFEAGPYATKGAIQHLQADVSHLDPLSQMLYIDTRANLPDDLLMVADKTSMANSLEVRVPFLDYRLVEFAESLPPGLKLKGLTGKYLHKRAMLKWLPREVVFRKKKGFANPMSHWLRTSMSTFVDDLLLAGDTHIARYFDQNYIRKIVRLDREGKEQFTRHIYLLLSLELWHRSFIGR